MQGKCNLNKAPIKGLKEKDGEREKKNNKGKKAREREGKTVRKLKELMPLDFPKQMPIFRFSP